MTRNPKPLWPLFVLLVVIALGMSNTVYYYKNLMTIRVYDFES
jgi:hypothetical protein